MEELLIERFEKCVRILVKLESMKAANYERMSRGEALAYPEDAIFNLLGDLLK